MLRNGGYAYDQSKPLIAEARKAVDLPLKRKKGSVDRLTASGVGFTFRPLVFAGRDRR